MVCRFRPGDSTSPSAAAAVRYDATDRVTLVSKDGDRHHHFTFDRIFPPTTLQEDLFACCGEPVVDKLLLGIHCTVVVYGQTGAGKTHTMLGPPHEEVAVAIRMMASRNPMRGLIPRCLERLFHKLHSSTTTSTVLKVCFVEVYMERVRDLLNEREPQQSLTIQEDPLRGGVYVAGATEHVVTTLEECLVLLAKGSQQKVVTSTKMNEDSNRSHGVFMITVEQHNGQDVRIGRLHMVDLAGSEKVSKTLAEGSQLDEANQINKSLLYLSMVIKSLTTPGHTHVPYMNSKLTRLLQDSLGGTTLTSHILNCSESSYNVEESLSTLRFGQRAKFIKNRPRVNKVMMQATTTSEELQRALQEVEQLRNQLALPTKNLSEELKTKEDENAALWRQLQRALDRENRREISLKERRAVVGGQPPPPVLLDLSTLHAKLDVLLSRTPISNPSSHHQDTLAEQLSLLRAENEELRQQHEHTQLAMQRTMKLHAQKVVLSEEQRSHLMATVSAQQGQLQSLDQELRKAQEEGQRHALSHERLTKEIRVLEERLSLRQERVTFLEGVMEGLLGQEEEEEEEEMGGSHSEESSIPTPDSGRTVIPSVSLEPVELTVEVCAATPPVKR